MRDSGAIGNSVALVNVADAFGLETDSTPASRRCRRRASRSSTRRPIRSARRMSRRSSAPPRRPIRMPSSPSPIRPTLSRSPSRRRSRSLDVGAFYVGVGTAFPAATRSASRQAGERRDGRRRHQPRRRGMQEYRKRHKEVTGADADYWASAMTYAGLEILGQAIERAGTHGQGRRRRRDQEGAVQDRDRRGQSLRQHQPQGLDRRPVAGRLLHGVAAEGIAGAKAPVKKGPGSDL